jgi:hypothetical protein
MTETTNKIQKWSYPLKVGAAEATDPQQFYDALAKANLGFYPVGSNGLWHGGIHFDDDSGLVSDLTEVRCIADGEVVAYRIDDSYPISNYSETPNAQFSTGFVLVKHVLTPPENAETSTTPNQTASPALTFYSLYMHLVDWKTYQDNPELKRPGYWGGGVSKVKATAPDSLLGLRVRSDQTSQSAELAVLPRGSIVTTKPAPAAQKWLEILSVSPLVAGLEQNTGWVFKKEMRHLSGDQYLIDKEAKDPIQEYTNGANLRDLTTGQVIGFLPVGTQVKVVNGTGQYKKLVEIVSGESIPKLQSNVNPDGLGKIFAASLEQLSEPQKPWGEPFVLPVPVKIKAGERVGYVGKYQNNGEPTSKNVLHLEVFSCDDVPAYIDSCRSLAASLPDDQKRLLMVHKGASQIVTHTDGINATNPPLATPSSPKVGFDTIIPTDVLGRMGADRKIKVGGGNSGAESFWWRLDNKLADESGQPLNGWLHEQTLITTRHSAWEWVGFQYITETIGNAENLAAHLDSQGMLTEEESPNYAVQLNAADGGPVRKWLYKIIDTDVDKKLSVVEIKAALEKYWLAQPISQLVSKYESEWFWNESKWSELDPIMKGLSGENDPDWEVEKQRIEKLSWWSQLAGQQAVIGDGSVWHFHPVGLVSNFFISRVRRDYDLGSLSSHYETGGRGSITVSGGAGDAGGASYGAYQMTSQVKIKNADGTFTVINGGTVKKFVNWSGMPWGSEFAGLTPGSSAFTAKWKNLVETKGQEFVDVEHEFIKVSHFDIQIKKVMTDTGIDLRYHSHTINDVVWSTAVQQGPGASIIVNAINSLGIPHEETKAYDEKLIDAIYNERGRKIVGGTLNGQLYYFSKNSISVQNGVAERFVSEKAKAQGRLKDESSY